MTAKAENFPKLNYRIKVSGNNIVLVEANNYESEIFTPQIVNGRLTLLNIIPNRRCCQITKTNLIKYAIKDTKNEQKYLEKPNVLMQKNVENLSVNQLRTVCAPLANSTPTCKKRKKSYDGESAEISADSTLPTPELVRRDIPSRSNLLEKSMLHLPVESFYPNPIEKKSQKLRSSITASENSNKTKNDSILNGSFQIICSPPIKNNKATLNTKFSTNADSISRWEKVLTPVRTYAKLSKKPIKSRNEEVKVKKLYKPLKFTPTYLVNPTQAPKVAESIEIKRRKLVIDTKTLISPKTFKMQQKESLSTRKKTSITVQPIYFGVRKPRQYLESVTMSAFDLLTNSNRNCRIARNLNEQFRRGCVNKASSTYPKYKLLSKVPSLQQDKEVLELSQILL